MNQNLVRNRIEIKITVKGHEIEEMEHGTVLELNDIVSLAHNVSLWALKLTHSVSFWAQKTLK